MQWRGNADNLRHRRLLIPEKCRLKCTRFGLGLRVVDRHPEVHPGAFPRLAFDRPGAISQLDSLDQRMQANASTADAAPHRFFDDEAFSIVLDVDEDVAVDSPEVDEHFGRAGVFPDVDEDFLKEPEDESLGGRALPLPKLA